MFDTWALDAGSPSVLGLEGREGRDVWHSIREEWNVTLVCGAKRDFFLDVQGMIASAFRKTW